VKIEAFCGWSEIAEKESAVVADLTWRFIFDGEDEPGGIRAFSMGGASHRLVSGDGAEIVRGCW
jgi:hypothetical protein